MATLKELQLFTNQIADLEELINKRLEYIISNIYSVYEPSLVPLSNGEVKDGAVDTGDMLANTAVEIDVETDPQFPLIPTSFILRIVNAPDYFIYVDQGTDRMLPRKFSSYILEDDVVAEAISDFFNMTIFGSVEFENELLAIGDIGDKGDNIFGGSSLIP